MESLNDIIKRFIGYHGKIISEKGIEIVLDLDPNMPKVYEDFLEAGGSPKHIQHLLVHLSTEVEDARPNKALYQTRYEDDKQKLILAHNGSPIPENSLSDLNDRLKEIAEKRREHTSMRHGNLIAAQAVQGHGGRIYLENLAGREYTVKTTAELPVKNDGVRK